MGAKTISTIKFLLKNMYLYWGKVSFLLLCDAVESSIGPCALPGKQLTSKPKAVSGLLSLENS